MARYKFRFFVDYMDSPLWAGNDETFNKFDNPAYLDRLPISKKLNSELEAFGKEINENHDGHLKSLKGFSKLEETKNDLLSRLREELGTEYEIIDELM